MKKMRTQTLVLSALLMAMYVVLSEFSINLPFLKIGFSPIPVILGGLLFGNLIGGMVGILGSFLSQLVTYGLMWTTIFWVIPVGVRGFLVGVYAKKKQYRLKGIEIFLLILVTSMIVTILNTLGLYASKIMDIATWKETIWVILWPRMLSSVMTSCVYAIVVIPIFRLLKKHLV